MGTLIMIGQLLLALTILITLHEFGHYFFARLFKTRVNKFYLFFDFLFPMPNVLNFSLLKKKVGDTEWGLGWFPFGGYVQIDGMVDETQTADELAAKPPQPWEFRSKKPWQKMLIMLGGIIVNLILGWLIYAFVLFTWGTKSIDNNSVKNGLAFYEPMMKEMGFKNGDRIIKYNGKDVTEFEPDVLVDIIVERGTVTVDRNGQNVDVQIPNDFIGKLSEKKINRRGLFDLRRPLILHVSKEAEKLFDTTKIKKEGFLNGDRIKSVNGQPVNFFDELAAFMENTKPNDTLNIIVDRNGQDVSLKSVVDNDKKIRFPLFNSIEKMEELGLLKQKITKYGFFESFPAAYSLAVKKLNGYIKQFALLFQPSTGAYKGMGGFASMAKAFGETWNWEHFWSFTAFMSLALAFMNFLPIPMLDGGYVLILLIEMITGRKIPEKWLDKINTIGFIIVIGLLLYTNGNDLFRKLMGRF